MTAKTDTVFDRLLDRMGRCLARRLNAPVPGYVPLSSTDFEALCATIRPGDILLVEGTERVSTAIKYLTQSTWSHAAIYVGDALPAPADGAERPRLIEVNLGQGCVAAVLSKYSAHNTRICRPVGLTAQDLGAVIAFMIGRVGLEYDMRNIWDLVRYFLPTPPVPVRWRRRMLTIGSGDPTRAICSSLIAQAFQSIRYPILPEIRTIGPSRTFTEREIFRIRHHSLFVPRDFDISPYFAVVKPTLVQGFDYRKLVWALPDLAPDDANPTLAEGAARP